MKWTRKLTMEATSRPITLLRSAASHFLPAPRPRGLYEDDEIVEVRLCLTPATTTLPPHHQQPSNERSRSILLSASDCRSSGRLKPPGPSHRHDGIKAALLCYWRRAFSSSLPRFGPCDTAAVNICCSIVVVVVISIRPETVCHCRPD